jgi:hypothetical protein
LNGTDFWKLTLVTPTHQFLLMLHLCLRSLATTTCID